MWFTINRNDKKKIQIIPGELTHTLNIYLDYDDFHIKGINLIGKMLTLYLLWRLKSMFIYSFYDMFKWDFGRQGMPMVDYWLIIWTVPTVHWK